VTIGAMLISPLMGPIMATGLALAAGHLASVAVSIAFSALLVWLLPFHPLHPRSSPARIPTFSTSELRSSPDWRVRSLFAAAEATESPPCPVQTLCEIGGKLRTPILFCSEGGIDMSNCSVCGEACQWSHWVNVSPHRAARIRAVRGNSRRQSQVRSASSDK
jgi:hypothetical protein